MSDDPRDEAMEVIAEAVDPYLYNLDHKREQVAEAALDALTPDLLRRLAEEGRSRRALEDSDE